MVLKNVQMCENDPENEILKTDREYFTKSIKGTSNNVKY